MPHSAQQPLLLREGPVITETTALPEKPVTWPVINSLDESTSPSFLPAWQDRGGITWVLRTFTLASISLKSLLICFALFHWYSWCAHGKAASSNRPKARQALAVPLQHLGPGKQETSWLDVSGHQMVSSPLAGVNLP